MALKEEIDLIVHSAHRDPFAVLGAHIVKSAGQGVRRYPRLSARRPPRRPWSICNPISRTP